MLKDKNDITNGKSSLTPYLSPLAVWALSFGCAVGWGAFVMPGTTFLPGAGPVGTALGMMLGAVVMLIIGMNYHYLMNKYPDAGGTLTYTIKEFGYDHGFLSSWFLMLVYVAIIWANASALGLISKNLLGRVFQFGFHYRILGYDVFFGEVLLSLTAILICGVVCIKGKRLAAGLQILFAFLLIGGVIICTAAVFGAHAFDSGTLIPAFSGASKHPAGQIFTIVALSPWAFVGFESVANSAEGFKFSVKKTIWIFAGALFTGAIAYILLTQIAVIAIPGQYSDWTGYIADLGRYEGIEGLPVFHAAYAVMGRAGIFLLDLSALAGIVTGLIGNFIAASRLMYSMAEEGILPEWFGRLNGEASPRNALVFLMVISTGIPFLGRTAIGWIVDVNTVGATIAYAYTSAAAFHEAQKEKDRRIQLTGVTGLIMSVVFFLYFMSWSAGAMPTESYLILASWSILGFVYFRRVFARDTERRFGKSTVVWIGLLFLIFFTSFMWVKQATDEVTTKVVTNISGHYEGQTLPADERIAEDSEDFISAQLAEVDSILTRNSIIQMMLLMASLAIMFSIYMTISRREKEMEAEKIKAEEGSRAKSTFLSNMSHDIRTPMNAIVGYIHLAEREDITFEETKEYLGKIKGSSQHLLALINDILEMSRIESGRMELEPVAADLKQIIGEVRDMFATQMSEKNIEFIVDISNIRHSMVYCDTILLNRVLLNLISNAYKFTPNEGTVSLTVWEIDNEEDGGRMSESCDSKINDHSTVWSSKKSRQDIERSADRERVFGQSGRGKYELRVADSGIGMSEEFAAKVFDAFERERTSTVSGIQGTGLGMSITKSIVDMMGGTIEVETAPGSGTEFIIRIELELQGGSEEPDMEAVKEAEQDKEQHRMSADFSSMRLLLAEDIEINREIATMMLKDLGFEIECAENGREAVDRVSASAPGYFDAVLMDIQMPVMDGYEATKAIRSLEDRALADIPVIAMTANAFSEDVRKAHDAGMNGHIAKPIDVDNMMNVLREVLG